MVCTNEPGVREVASWLRASWPKSGTATSKGVRPTPQVRRAKSS
jgi:hypothetical protein